MPSYVDQLYGVYYSEYSLYHHGIKGQKWGVRRFQNEDGTRTDAGKRREKLGFFDKTPSKLTVNSTDSAITKRVKNDYSKMNESEFRRKYSTSKRTYAKRVMKSDTGDPYADRRNKVKGSDSKLQKKIFNKAVDAESKQMTSVHLAEKTEKYDKSQSAGKRIAKRLLFGDSGTRAYNMARTAGISRGKAAVATALAGTRSTMNYADKRYQRSAEGRRYTSNTRRAYDN